jgi:dTDP-3-amino-2,3,6-trideoxy-4-keto-D-glucose/dTDP-3-amino-3,4,6-trideoxy-alpha-D-glucose/dTDP-2,6-dideoxy-D-kanosamine transaminase
MIISIPFNDLMRGTDQLRPQIDEAISRVVSSGWFVLGPEHDAFESELADFVGTKHAINVGNGTDALELALAAIEVRAGDYVVTVANAGAYATTAIRLLGAFPLYADVDEKTLLISRSSLEAVLKLAPEKPKAIVVTHLYGALAPMNEICDVAAIHRIPVLEDCAQSLGAESAEGMGGGLADIATTSFYPTKNLGALGDGGAIFTNSDELADSVRRMRQYGWHSKYNIQYSHGRNSRLDEMQAAILRAKLPHLQASNERRRQIHSAYESASPTSANFVNHSNPSFIAHLAVLASSNREKLRSQLADEGISTDVHYPIPDHKQGFPDFTPIQTPLEVTEWASRSVFSIPMFPELSDQEVEYIKSALGNF